MRTYIYLTLLLLVLPLFLSAQDLHTLNKDLPCLDRHFNIKVHINVDSTRILGVALADIETAVEQTNRYFEPICVSFSICEVDTIHNYNFDSLANGFEIAEKSILHQDANRLNIYIMTDLLDETVCGLGGGSTIHLEKGCLGAMTHEMGHVWGLAHTFEGNGNENVDGSNCETSGDGICDTPADPYDPSIENEIWQDGCEFTWLGLDANGQFYQPDMGNIMSYYGCDCGFTRGQYLRMASLIQNSNLW
ncbi:M43 family zinc metalloprotease [Saprospiraceae bacterium]|nr:M43 family zinc metalloprotease [Saprospiraceae bacterium]